jgi:hypothetical protein
VVVEETAEASPTKSAQSQAPPPPPPPPPRRPSSMGPEEAQQQQHDTADAHSDRATIPDSRRRPSHKLFEVIEDA